MSSSTSTPPQNGTKRQSVKPTHVLEALENLPTPPQMNVPRSPLEMRRMSDVLSDRGLSVGKDDSFESAVDQTVNEDASFVSANDSASVSFLSLASPDQQKAAAAAVAAAVENVRETARRRLEAAESRVRRAEQKQEAAEQKLKGLQETMMILESELKEQRSKATQLTTSKAANWLLAAATGAGAAAFILGTFLYTKSLSARRS